MLLTLLLLLLLTLILLLLSLLLLLLVLTLLLPLLPFPDPSKSPAFLSCSSDTVIPTPLPAVENCTEGADVGLSAGVCWGGRKEDEEGGLGVELVVL